MDHSIITTLIQSIETLLTNYGQFTVALSVFFLGENAALAVFALSAKGLIDPRIAFAWAFLGSFASDIFWFLIAEYVFKKYYERKIKEAKQDKSNRFFMRLIDKYFFITLVVIKFLVGMRLILTLYIVLKNKIPFITKAALNIIATTLFMGVLFPIGWHLGLGSSNSLSIEENLVQVMTIVVGSIIVLHLLTKVVSKLIARDYKKKNNGIEL
jgi:membrane protein DedA with SNARE-associated domain